MSAVVVDTNVPVVANGKAEHADADCVIACVDALLAVRESGIIVLDDSMLILSEYMNHLSIRGQPGPGDLFMKWVWNVQADENRCERVALTQLGQSFREFPNDAQLQGFDPSDHKFVAVAKGSQYGPVILNAVDSDWANFRHALVQNGVQLRFLCPQHVAPI